MYKMPSSSAVKTIFFKSINLTQNPSNFEKSSLSPQIFFLGLSSVSQFRGLDRSPSSFSGSQYQNLFKKQQRKKRLFLFNKIIIFLFVSQKIQIYSCIRCTPSFDVWFWGKKSASYTRDGTVFPETKKCTRRWPAADEKPPPHLNLDRLNNFSANTWTEFSDREPSQEVSTSMSSGHQWKEVAEECPSLQWRT